MQQNRDETRDIFDVIATYFTNTYWVPLFAHAISAYNEKRFGSIQDAYKSAVEGYRVSFCALNNAEGRPNENYFKVIDDLLSSYNTWMRTDLTKGDLIHVVCKQLIPPDHFKRMPRQDQRKDTAFRRVLSQAVTNFTLFVSTKGLADLNGRVRNNQQAGQQRMRAWKQEFMKIMYHERDELYSRFMAVKSGIDPAKRRTPITREAFDKMTEKIKQLVFEKAKLQKQLNNYVLWSKGEIKKLKGQIAGLNGELVEAGVRAPRRSIPSRMPRVDEIEEAVESESSGDSGESAEEGSKDLPKINDPVAEQEREDNSDEDDDAAPLDAVPEFSGEDYIAIGNDLGSDISDSELSADQ